MVLLWKWWQATGPWVCAANFFPTGLFGRDDLLPDALFWKVLTYWRSERDV